MDSDTTVPISEIVVAVAFYVIGARVTVRTHSIWKGGLVTYGLLILWAILFCVVLPMTVAKLSGDPSVMDRLFPDARGVVGITMLGWFQGFVFAALVRGIHVVVARIKEHKSQAPNNTPDGIRQPANGSPKPSV